MHGFGKKDLAGFSLARHDSCFAQGDKDDRVRRLRTSMGEFDMAHLNREQALSLVRRLASDSDFHRRFQHSPKDALDEMKLPSAFALCCSNINLPHQDVLRSSEASLVNDLSAHSDLHVIGLNVK